MVLTPARRHFGRNLVAAALALACRPAFGGLRRPAIVAERVFAGGRMMRQADPFAMPMLLSGAATPIVGFVAPIAVAAGAQAFFVADAGLGHVLRYDIRHEVMSVVTHLRVDPRIRLAAAPDGSLIVSNGGGTALRYFAGGHPPQVLRPSRGQVAFDEVVVDGATGSFFALDRAQSRIEVIQAAGGGGIVHEIDGLPDGVELLAAGRERIYLSSRSCHCIYVTNAFGPYQWEQLAGDFWSIVALAAYDDWLAVLDGGQRRLFVYHGGRLSAEADFAALGMGAPHSAAIHDDLLYVADSVRRRVLRYRLMA